MVVVYADGDFDVNMDMDLDADADSDDSAKASTLSHASRTSFLLHSSDASAEPVNVLPMGSDTLETSQAEMPGWLKLVA